MSELCKTLEYEFLDPPNASVVQQARFRTGLPLIILLHSSSWSSFKLQSSWGRSIKTEKDGLRNPLVCWKFSRRWCLHQRSKLNKGGADRPPLCTFRCFVSQDDGKCGGGARHEVKWSTRVLLCCPCFWEFVTFEGLAEERDSEKMRDETRVFNRMMSASAMLCAATLLQGKRPL